MNRTLIIGSTGTVGRQVVCQLLQRDTPVRALTRKPENARFPPQVEVVRGDLTLPETLDACLEGISAVFLVWVAPPSAVVPAIKQITRRPERIVFLSAPLKTAHPLFQQPNPARTLGLQIEDCIEASGLRWTFLRPGMFAANARQWWGPQIRAGDVVRWPYLSVPTAPIDELLDAWAAASGQPAFVTSTVEEITGAPARTFLEWATDHAPEFRGRYRSGRLRACS